MYSSSLITGEAQNEKEENKTLFPFIVKIKCNNLVSTGVIIDAKNGLILTNSHCVADAECTNDTGKEQ